MIYVFTHYNNILLKLLQTVGIIENHEYDYIPLVLQFYESLLNPQLLFRKLALKLWLPVMAYTQTLKSKKQFLKTGERIRFSALAFLGVLVQKL